MAFTIQSTVPFSLPVCPGITEAQLARVVDEVKEHFGDGV
jgi:hypothetical protein